MPVSPVTPEEVNATIKRDDILSEINAILGEGNLTEDLKICTVKKLPFKWPRVITLPFTDDTDIVRNIFEVYRRAGWGVAKETTTTAGISLIFTPNVS